MGETHLIVITCDRCGDERSYEEEVAGPCIHARMDADGWAYHYPATVRAVGSGHSFRDLAQVVCANCLTVLEQAQFALSRHDDGDLRHQEGHIPF